MNFDLGILPDGLLWSYLGRIRRLRWAEMVADFDKRVV